MPEHNPILAPDISATISRPDVTYRAAVDRLMSRDVTTVLRRIIAGVCALTAADAAAILLYDREAIRFVPAVPSVAVGLDEQWLQGQGLVAAQSLALRAVKAQDVVDLPDTAGTPELEFPLLAGGQRPGAVGVAPLTIENSVIGVLSVYHLQPRATRLDGPALRSFAELAGVTVTIARTHEREALLLARLEALDGASRTLASELSLERVLQRIVEIAVQLVDARYGAVGVAGADGYLIDFITTGITSEERARIGPLPRGHGLLGVLIREGASLRVPNIQHDPRRVGFPPHHPPMTSLLGVPIRVHNAIVGDLYLTDKIGADEFSEEDQRLAEMLAAHAGIAIENARLYAQVGELTRLRERERIARDLHDGIIQDIYAATLQLDDLSEGIPDHPTQRRLVEVADRLSAVITDVRTYIQGLRARELEGRLLSEGLADLVREVNGRGNLVTRFLLEGTPYRFPDESANTLLQIAREALSNVIKHAQATHAEVYLAYAPQGVTLTVADDGRGFDPALPRNERHRGLLNLQGRAEDIGGHLTVQSTPGAGTTLSAFIPAPL